MYTSNDRPSKYKKQKLTERTEERDNSTIIIEDFSVPLLIMDRITQQNIGKNRGLKQHNKTTSNRPRIPIHNRIYILFLFSFWWDWGLGFKLRALHSQSRCSTARVTPAVHFGLVILEMGVSRTVFPGWAATEIVPISTSQVIGITGVSYWCLVPRVPILKYT
jgi:hypothetical protein